MIKKFLDFGSGLIQPGPTRIPLHQLLEAAPQRSCLRDERSDVQGVTCHQHWWTNRGGGGAADTSITRPFRRRELPQCEECLGRGAMEQRLLRGKQERHALHAAP